MQAQPGRRPSRDAVPAWLRTPAGIETVLPVEARSEAAVRSPSASWADTDPIEGWRADGRRWLRRAGSRERATQNLALAEDEVQYKAVAAVFETLRREEQVLEAELRQAELDGGPALDIESEVGAALVALEMMEELAVDPTNLGAIGELFRQAERPAVPFVPGGAAEEAGRQPGGRGRRDLWCHAPAGAPLRGSDRTSGPEEPTSCRDRHECRRKSCSAWPFRGSERPLVRNYQSGREDLNLRPHGPEPCALAKLSYAPFYSSCAYAS